MQAQTLAKGKRGTNKGNTRISRLLPLPDLPNSNCTYHGIVSHVLPLSILTITAIVHATTFSYLNCCRSPTLSAQYLFYPILHSLLTALFFSVVHKAAASLLLESLGEQIFRSNPPLLNLNLHSNKILR